MVIIIRDDERCQFPGCQGTININIHHVIPRSYAYNVLKMSPTEFNNINNGILLCAKHHKLIHQGFEDKKIPWDTEWDKELKRSIEENVKKHMFQSVICI